MTEHRLLFSLSGFVVLGKFLLGSKGKKDMPIICGDNGKKANISNFHFALIFYKKRKDVENENEWTKRVDRVREFKRDNKIPREFLLYEHVHSDLTLSHHSFS